MKFNDKTKKLIIESLNKRLIDDKENWENEINFLDYMNFLMMKFI